ncbi:hypothetical protein M0R45_015208 [Rubus argutus]|uniref:Uncharacterized protein n=1 Tax=Rubus argutus TaxID=59490 RepID=A0AAW1XRH0_RUBAR
MAGSSLYGHSSSFDKVMLQDAANYQIASFLYTTACTCQCPGGLASPFPVTQAVERRVQSDRLRRCHHRRVVIGGDDVAISSSDEDEDDENTKILKGAGCACRSVYGFFEGSKHSWIAFRDDWSLVRNKSQISSDTSILSRSDPLLPEWVFPKGCVGFSAIEIQKKKDGAYLL